MGQTVGVFLTGKAALMREFGPGFVGKTAVGWAAWKGGKRSMRNGMLVAHAFQRSATGNPEQKTQLY
jgi:hypothetical protein